LVTKATLILHLKIKNRRKFIPANFVVSIAIYVFPVRLIVVVKIRGPTITIICGTMTLKNCNQDKTMKYENYFSESYQKKFHTLKLTSGSLTGAGVGFGVGGGVGPGSDNLYTQFLYAPTFSESQALQSLRGPCLSYPELPQ